MSPAAVRLSGPRVALVPVPHDVAVAAVHGPGPALDAALARAGLRAAADWPHGDTADALRPLAEHGRPGDLGTWLVCADGAVIGECGWAGRPDPAGAVEIGYGLAPSARGRGLGTEAVAVLGVWSEQQPGVRSLVAEVLVGNEASLRLLSRLGFVREPAAPPYVRLVRGPGTRPRPGRIAGRHVC